MKVKSKKKKRNGVIPVQPKNNPSSYGVDDVKENFLQGVDTYLKLGFKFNLVDGKGLPEYPQVLYTLTGNWKGWNHILGTDPNSKHYSENILQDKKDFNLFRNIWLMILETNIDIPEIHFQRIWEKVVEGSV